MTALVIKFAMITAVLWIVLGGFYDVSFGDIFATSLILTALAFLADVYLLPVIENFGATLGDFGLAFAGVWVLGNYLFEETIPLGTATLISALIIAAGEFFFHQYMENAVFERGGHDRTEYRRRDDKLQTEFGEDMDTDAERRNRNEEK
ncbi:YndM family protein [Virgibacillus xinjiangensis]|uniref:YndM family protein n=1 Tax=Virgibacillus xinjiangensis TaxID=393090 RepID=A0ABV7CQQ4_9BACI